MSTDAVTPKTNIDSVLQESRVFPPPAEFSRRAHIKSMAEYETHLQGIGGESGAVLGRHRPGPALVQTLEQSAGVERALGQVVRRRRDQSFLQLSRPPRSKTGSRQQDRHHLGRRAGGEIRTLTYQQLLNEVSEVRQCAQVARHQERRPRRHLHGHESRAADRHAGLRPHRRAALGDLRRLLGQRAGGPHHRFAGGGRHYPGRLLPPRRRGQAQADRGRGAGSLPLGEARHRLQAHRDAGDHEAGPRSLVARADGQGQPTTAPPSRWTPSIRCTSSTPPAPPANPRAWSTPPAATRSTPTSPPSGSSISRTKTSTGARPTSAG